jgi:uridine kinase
MRVTDSIKPSKPYLVGVSGGSGSGKTHFAHSVRQSLGSSHCEIVPQDNFYIDQSARFDADGGSVNFDHPNSIDSKLLAACLRRLKMGEAVDIPKYDFATHKRALDTLKIEARSLIIIDGILIFHFSEIRVIFDELIFFDTPENLRFSRRLERDVSERGRTAHGVRAQFVNQVKPMHDQFVEPSKRYATTIIDDPLNLTGAVTRFLEGFKLQSSGR